MLSHVHSKQLPAKAETARLSLGVLMFNNLTDSYTSTNLIRQVTKDNTHL
jgi:hypothetical protein